MPNVILISTDHMRYDNIAAHDNPAMHTPNLDRLLAEGVGFDNCFVQSPTCMPSRASIWTGRYPQNHRVTCNGVALRKSETTLAHAFQHARFHTANVGKLHFQPHSGFDIDHAANHDRYAGYGYDANLLSDEPGCYPDAYIQWVRWHAPEHLEQCKVPGPAGPRRHFDYAAHPAPEPYTHPAWITDQSCQFLRRWRHRDRPFFLSMGFYAPHPPLNPPQQYLDLYDPEAIPKPRVGHLDPDKVAGGHTDEQWRQMKRHFYAMVSHVDDCVGRLLQCLQDTGLDRDTIVVFTSDHGDSLGDYGRCGKGPWNHDAVIRVPLVVRWPDGLPAGRRVPALVESIDLFPTLCALADAPIPQGVKGLDQSDLLRGRTDVGRDDILVEHKQVDRGRSVKTLRTETHKYLLHSDGRETLYDLSDPDGESRDLLADESSRADHAGTRLALRDRLLARLIAAEDDLPPRRYPY